MALTDLDLATTTTPPPTLSTGQSELCQKKIRSWSPLAVSFLGSTDRILHFHPQECLASSCGCFTPLRLICCCLCLESLLLCLPGGLLFIPQDAAQVVPLHPASPQPTLFSTSHAVSFLSPARTGGPHVMGRRQWLRLESSEDLLTPMSGTWAVRSLTAGAPQEASLSLSFSVFLCGKVV